jgi:fucose 4-O-acetylase-like acetyltransferase
MKIKIKYLEDINSLTGLAIVFVVIGHLVTGKDIDSKSILWYKFLKEYIYSFHMPLFIFVSGFLLYYTMPTISSISNYKKYIFKKINRLVPSFLFFAFVIFITKILLESNLKVDNPVNSYWDFFKIFYMPTFSFAGYLWYIYVLLLYYIILPILLNIINIEFLFLFSIPLAAFSFTPYFALDFFFEFLPFCLLGCLASKYYQVYKSILTKSYFSFIIIFVSVSFIFYFYRLPKVFMGLISIPAFHSLILYLKSNKIALLPLFGKYTFAIYLMNTIVIGFIKAISFKYLGFSYNNFEYLFILLVIGGLFIPILIKIFIINKLPIVGKYLA